MINIYTSIGKLILHKGPRGTYPVVNTGSEKKLMEIPELILWSKSIFHFSTPSYLESEFTKEEKMLGDMNFEFIKNRLLSRGLLVGGRGGNDSEALWNLLSNLYVCCNKKTLNESMSNLLKNILGIKEPGSLTIEEKHILKLAASCQLRVDALLELAGCDKEDLILNLKEMYFKKLIVFNI